MRYGLLVSLGAIDATCIACHRAEDGAYRRVVAPAILDAPLRTL